MANEMKKESKRKGRGWHGDPQGHAQAGRLGGKASHKKRIERAAEKIEST